MPIDTRLDGNPATLFSGAQWLRGRLGFAVRHGAITMRLAGAEARHGWVGDAGAAFSGRMSTAAGLADRLEAEVEATATTLTEYGRTLAVAQARLQAVRALAAGQGLAVTGTLILDPVAADPVTQARQQVAYALAMSQVAELRALMAGARSQALARQAQARAVPPIVPTDLAAAAGATASLSGQAMTAGEGFVPWADGPAGELLAHEPAHVLQQRSGVPSL